VTKMRLDEHTTPRFTARNLAFACIGLGSLITLVLTIVFVMEARPGHPVGWAMFVISPLLGLAGVVLNVKGLIRIREGEAGEYDLILTWPGFFSASFACLAHLVLLLMVVAA
jgi:hypothetical protein